MKKLLIAVLASLILSACTDQKAQEKTILDSVIKVHDKVMGSEERLMDNKMKLDTILKQADSAANTSAAALRKQLTMADNAMEDWMHKFDPDYKGKTDEETVAYLNDQKKQIMAIDSLVNTAINESDKYLKKIKSK